MKTAKRWIVSAGACLLALTSMSVSFGQIPTAPVPEQNNDGLPLLTEPAPLTVEPIQAPADLANVPDPEFDVAPAPVTEAAPQAVAPATKTPQSIVTQTETQPEMPQPEMSQPEMPQPNVAPQPYAAPQPYVAPQPAPITQDQRPCRQCQRCPAGAYYSPTPYYGQDTVPWWLHIRPVPYTPVEHVHHGMGHHGFPMGGRLGNDRLPRLAPIEPPFYSVRGPRDFYLDNPRPLGY